MNPPKAAQRPPRAASASPPDEKTLAAGDQSETQSPATTRKAWKPKTPVEVVLEQIHKQEKKVADLQEEIDREKASLNKLLQAKKVLES